MKIKGFESKRDCEHQPVHSPVTIRSFLADVGGKAQLHISGQKVRIAERKRSLNIRIHAVYSDKEDAGIDFSDDALCNVYLIAAFILSDPDPPSDISAYCIANLINV